MTAREQADRIRAAVAEELGLQRSLFGAAGLTFSEPKLVVWRPSEGEYTAELNVEFYEDDDLVDFFEFFVCQDGVPTTTEQEARKWVRSNAADVVQRRRGR